MKIDPKKLNSTRRALGITQKELAHAIGVTQQFLCQLEKGHKPASFETAVALAKALQVQPEELCTDLNELGAIRRRQKTRQHVEVVQAVVLQNDREMQILTAYRADPVIREMLNRLMRFDLEDDQKDE